MISKIVDLLLSENFWKIVFALGLFMITLFRKRLSSNHVYRQGGRRRSASRQGLSAGGGSNSGSNAVPGSTLSSRGMLEHTRGSHQDKGIVSIFSSRRPSFLAKKSSTHCALTALAPELLVQVLSYLETHEVVNISMTSSKMRQEFTADYLWQELWRETFGKHWHYPAIKTIREHRGIYWDPKSKSDAPLKGWYHFYLAFEVCWYDWLLAGYNTKERSLLAIDDAIFDVTEFLSEHPGSPETLSERIGCDASQMFREICHSEFAEGLKRRYCIWDLQGQYCLQPHGSEGDKGGNGEIYTLDFVEGRVVPGLRIPPPSRLKPYWKCLQKSVVDLAKKAFQPSLTQKMTRMTALTLQELGIYSDKPKPIFVSTKAPVEGLEGYCSCQNEEHLGESKAVFDPLIGEWTIWWSCCGRAHKLQVLETD
eukprot:gene3587-3928_t